MKAKHANVYEIKHGGHNKKEVKPKRSRAVPGARRGRPFLFAVPSHPKKKDEPIQFIEDPSGIDDLL